MKVTTVAQSAAFAMAILMAAQISFAQSSPGPFQAEKAEDKPAAQRFPWPPPFACESTEAAKNRHEAMKKQFAEALQLTPEQQNRIEAIHQSFFKSHQSEMMAHRSQMEEICRLKAAGASPDEILAKIPSPPKPDFKKFQAEREQHDAQIKALLTPEQAKKFEALRPKHPPMPKHRGCGPEGFPPPLSPES